MMIEKRKEEVISFYHKLPMIILHSLGIDLYEENEQDEGNKGVPMRFNASSSMFASVRLLPISWLIQQNPTTPRPPLV